MDVSQAIICHRCTCVHVDSALWLRSELTVDDSVVGLTPDHFSRWRKRRGYNSISGLTGRRRSARPLSGPPSKWSPRRRHPCTHADADAVHGPGHPLRIPSRDPIRVSCAGFGALSRACIPVGELRARDIESQIGIPQAPPRATKARGRSRGRCGHSTAHG